MIKLSKPVKKGFNLKPWLLSKPVKKGFTIIELLVAIAVSMLLIIPLTNLVSFIVNEQKQKPLDSVSTTQIANISHKLDYITEMACESEIILDSKYSVDKQINGLTVCYDSLNLKSKNNSDYVNLSITPKGLMVSHRKNDKISTTYYSSVKSMHIRQVDLVTVKSPSISYIPIDTDRKLIEIVFLCGLNDSSNTHIPRNYKKMIVIKE